MSDAEHHEDTWRPRYNPWAIALTVTLATFMEVLDTSIANVALPHIAGSLGASSEEATWVLTSYLVSSAIVLPISGWLSNRIGRKRFYMGCVALFTICSFLCGIATSLPQLIVFRMLQGFFGGGLQPNQQSIILDTFPPEKRAASASARSGSTDKDPQPGRCGGREGPRPDTPVRSSQSFRFQPTVRATSAPRSTRSNVGTVSIR